MTHKKKLTDKDIEMIRSLSAVRLPTDQIAAILKISKETLERMMKTNAAVRDAIQEGRAQASGMVRRTAYDLAVGRPARKVKDLVTGKETIEAAVPPDVQALKWWTATQEGFKTANKLEITGEDGKPIEVSNLSKEERMAKISALQKKLKLTEDE